MRKEISLEQLDLRLLTTFVTLYQEGHVGRTADRLGLSQPRVSLLLGQLRRISGDLLFTRTSHGMQPTALAREWAKPVGDALRALQTALSASGAFDPQTARRTFTIYMSEIGQCVVLNRLVGRVAKLAPGVRLRIINVWDGPLASRLDDGSVDIALGWIPQLAARKTSAPLFKDRYIGIKDQSLPKSRSGGAPAEARYAMATFSNTAHQVVIERFQSAGIQPAVTASSFLVLPDLLVGTSLTAVVTERFAHLLQQRGFKVSPVELPVRLPALNVRLHWSTRTYRDPGVDWLREQVVASVRSYLAGSPPLSMPRPSSTRAALAAR